MAEPRFDDSGVAIAPVHEPSIDELLQWAAEIQRGERPIIEAPDRGVRSRAKQALGLSKHKE
jgi:hypothetical protein